MHGVRTLPPRSRGSGTVRSEDRPPFAAAMEAGAHPSTAPDPGSNRPAFDPERRAPSAIEFTVLGQQTNVVSHPDAAGERDVSVRQFAVSVRRLFLGESKEVRHSIPSDPDHDPGAAATTAASPYGCGCWHTGQYTAGRAMIVRHRTQYFALGGGGIGPTAPGGATKGAA